MHDGPLFPRLLTLANHTSQRQYNHRCMLVNSAALSRTWRGLGLTIRLFYLRLWMGFWGGNVFTVSQKHHFGTPSVHLLSPFTPSRGSLTPTPTQAKLEVAEANRAAQAFSSDEWKFYNEEVSRCSAMVMSDKAMVLKLTPAPGTYSHPPPPPHMHNTQPHNTLVDSLAPSAKREGGVAPARRTRLGCV